ncbi:MAG TPA: type II toxin-antitoxin system RelB/DinJ family antitoxin [Candidatus Olsenella stercoravium]|uniref:Type II toxin-antitoxin system RelB/DinJ family antitoxin n=1 Tax=Candidatus Olsenella stercoravium TaxID=2838713 RepID=A0A9D2DK98_9ACTN|nr:type II toxin-antitoxin system RelB/DinJ family antitoxin [Candidatus Olsenella stercoravium]
MATAVVSGRVDEKVRQRADAYIRAAGFTPAEVIKVVWENIARTGEVPEETPAVATQGPMERLAELRESFGEADWLVNLTKEEMRDMIASRYA